MRCVLPGALVVLTSALVACGSTVSTSDPLTATRTTGSTAELNQQLDELTVVPRGSMQGYDRDRYPHWSNQGDNCNTREVVLKRDGVGVQVGDNCSPIAGTWTSPYDGATWTDPSEIDVDHVVPLANSWVSGARSWTQQQREAFANDLQRPQLRAVTDNVNQEKSDMAPDEWRPPVESDWCQYSTDWITVKHYYKLTVTEEEKVALKDMLTRC